MKNHVVCLYEYSGLSGADWARAGYTVWCYDLRHIEIETRFMDKGKMIFVPWDAHSPDAVDSIVNRHRDRVAMLLAFPECTDLAFSGVRHFESKAAKDPDYLNKALHLVRVAHEIGSQLKCPQLFENPVGRMSVYYRPPDRIIQPYEYGGYLPEYDQHPMYPDLIPGRDAYSKRTCVWVDWGFKFPERKPVEIGWNSQHLYKKLGGWSKVRTRHARSLSPRGFMRAIYEANNGK